MPLHPIFGVAPAGSATRLFLDEDDMASDSAVAVASQQSVKAFFESDRQATQAAVEAETNENTYVPPDLIKNSPGVAKVWGYVTYSGGTPTLASPSYNVTSITDTGTGILTVTVDTDFADADYSVQVTCREDVPTTNIPHFGNLAVGSFTAEALNEADTNVDPAAISFVAFGDQ